MDYTPDHIWLLIARKLSGEASIEEVQELEELIRHNPDAGYSKEIFYDLWRTQPHEDRQYAENRYKELVQQMKNMGIADGKFDVDDHYINAGEAGLEKQGRKHWLMAVGAVALVFLILTGMYYYKASTSTRQVETAGLSSNNQIATKNGSKTSLVLPDGTKVWLNSGSQLDYDKTYGNTLREVSLVGEAYFDVVKNAAKPFVIHTKKMDIKVLGTAFNVKCYPGEKTTETSLVRGSIEVTLKDRQEKIMLKPNEKLVINNDDIAAPEQKGNKLKLADSKVTATEKPIITLSHLTFLPADSTVIETAWVQNRLLFSSETFEDVALKMERWYNVKIDFADDNLKDSKLTGNFEKETVGEAFNALQLTTKFLYSIKSDRITIYNNRSTIAKK
jgi:ferric-dicitrate binding protein FerR (iron transport regulator)